MYDETNVPGPEYRVRPVVRYVVTRYCHPYQSRDGRTGMSGSSTVVGEFHSEENAYNVAKSLESSESQLHAALSLHECPVP